MLTPVGKSETLPASAEIIFLHPLGAKLNDVYMDAQQVAQELNISKRTVRNMRISGKLSFTTLFGKIFYYRQEITALLEANKILKKIKYPLVLIIFLGLKWFSGCFIGDSLLPCC